MPQKSEYSEFYCTRRICYEIDQDTQKAEGLDERIASERVSTEGSTSSLAIVAYVRRVESINSRVVVFIRHGERYTLLRAEIFGSKIEVVARRG